MITKAGKGIAKRIIFAALLILTMCFLTCNTASAITLKTAPELLEELEQDYKEALKELRELEGICSGEEFEVHVVSGDALVLRAGKPSHPAFHD